MGGMIETCTNLLTVKQAAEFLNVSERTVHRNAAKWGAKVGGCWRFDVETLRRLALPAPPLARTPIDPPKRKAKKCWLSPD